MSRGWRSAEASDPRAGRRLHDHDDAVTGVDHVDQLRHRSLPPPRAPAHPGERLLAVLAAILRVAAVPLDVGIEQLGDRVEVAPRDRGETLLASSVLLASSHLLSCHGDSRRSDQPFLQAADRVEVVAGPDHAHAGGGRVAVAVPQIAGDRVDQPPVGAASRGSGSGTSPAPARLAAKRSYQARELLGGSRAAPAARRHDRRRCGGSPSPFQRSSTASAASRTPATPVTSAVTSASGTVLAPRSVR